MMEKSVRSFGFLSGLEINMSKSAIVGINIEEELKDLL